MSFVSLFNRCFGKRSPTIRNKRREGTHFRPRLEMLEDRLTPSTTFVVTDTADLSQQNGGTNNATDTSGLVSLRSAIAAANFDANAGASDTITFAPNLNGTTITLTQGQLELMAGTGTTIIDGGGQITVSGNNASRVFQVDSGSQAGLDGLAIVAGYGDNEFGGGIANLGTLTLNQDTLAGNSASGGNGIGGALYNSGLLTVNYTTFSGNSNAAEGGAIYNSAGGTATLNNSTLFGNSTTYVGGAIDNHTFAVMAINDCTIADNFALGGGGIDNDHGALTMTNSTIADNRAGGSAGLNVNLGTASLTGCTVTGNVATVNNGGIYTTEFALTLQDTIVAGNTAPYLQNPNVDYIATDNGYNLLGTDVNNTYDPNPGPGDIFSDAPDLAPLGNYGGPTETVALLPGSPAIGTGEAVAGISTDQRGFPLDTPPDIGAFQSQTVVVPAPSMTTASDAGGTYTGSPFPASGTVTGTGGLNTTPTSFLYVGTGSTVYTATSVAPTNVGTYTVTASYAGDADHTGSSSGAVPFVITAVGVTIGGDVYVLNQTASGALTISGNAVFNVAGTLQVDSNSASAVNLSGNAEVSAAQTLIVGGDHVSGHVDFDSTVTTAAAYVADPLAVLAAQAGTSAVAVNLSGSQTLTLNPGVYSSITVSGNAHLTFAPGIYVIGSGGVTVSGNGVVTGGADAGGQGILIYNNGVLTVSGSASVNLTAFSTGDYAGLAIFQARTDTSAVTISGNANLNLNGSFLYDANVQSTVTISGNAQVEASLVVNELTISGNSDDTAQ